MVKQSEPISKDEPVNNVNNGEASATHTKPTETTEPSQPQANNQPVVKAATVVRRGLSLNLSLRLDGDIKDE